MISYRLTGGCHCGCIRVDVELSRAPDTYSPRVCDCGFCHKHGASYLSDPAGALRIQVQNMNGLGRYRQGSKLADFLFCKTCGVLVGVAYHEEGRMFATINSLVIEGGAGFAEKKTVSPRTLSAAGKIGRWKEFWFSDVTLVSDDPSPNARADD